VGDVNSCSNNITFEYTLNGAEGAYYGVEGTANVRDASLKVTLDNPAGNEVEIYLYSINTEDNYTYGAGQPIYSLPYKTISNGEITIPVNSLSNVDGFDPERVGGVYVKTNGSASVTSVMSACDNVVAIKGCSAAYDKTAGKWKISTEVNSYTHVKSIKVQETSNYISGDNDAECGDSPACAWSGITGRVAKNVLPIEDANPYIGTGVRSYAFSVTLVTDDDQTLPTCNTEPVEISTTEGVCGSLTSTTIRQGQGLPVFSYGIENCPDEHCGFKVLLSDGAEIVAPTESGDGSWNTDENAANKTNALEAGDYYFTLQSTDNPAAFSSCNSATFKVTSSTVTGSCSITGEPYQGQTLTLNVTSISGDVESGGSDMTWTLKDGSSNTVTTQTIKCNSSSCWANTMAAPDVGDYTYTLTFGGKEVCSGNITINPKLTCSVNKNSLTFGESFTFTATYGGTSYNTSFTGNGVSHNNNQMSYTITPTATGTQPYDFSVTGGSIGAASCETINVVVGEPTPTATCPTETINAEPGTTIKFTPTVTGCGSGCNYTVDWVGHSGDPKKSVTNYGYTSGEISFAGDAVGGNNTYRFTVVNKKTSDNSADCEVTVNYQKPTYGCPEDMEVKVGATVSVTPTSVTNCTQGCGYKVTKGSSTGTEVIGPGTGYKSGALGSGFTGESTAKTVTYYVTLSNPAGDGEVCDFDVKYSSSSGSANCFFAENNTSGGTVITGSVTPKYAMNICVSGRSEGSNTTVTGKHFNNNQDENLSANFYVNANQTNCYYFVAPSAEGSYAFNVKVNNASICSTAPTLAVEQPSGGMTCYFAEANTNGATVITSVAPKNGANICVTNGTSQAGNSVVTGRIFDGNNDANLTNGSLYINANNTSCYYFAAPATSGSYQFDVKLNGVSVCDNAPTISVQ
jgi:hypothetical protein